MSNAIARRAVLAGTLGAALLPNLPRAQAPGAFAAMEKPLAERIAKLNGIGILAVAQQKRLVHVAGFGGMKPGDRYRVFSLSKSVTGLALLSLVQAGKLELDAPISKYIGPLLQKLGPPADPRVPAVTVRQVMTHMGGFVTNEREDDPIVINGPGGFKPPKGRERDPSSWRKEDLLPVILKRKLEAEPGTKYIYSNAGYVILCLVVEAASGMSYEDYCRDFVLKPGGLALPTVERDRRYLDGVSGWQMTAPEVLKLFWLFEPEDTRVLNAAMHKVALDPSGAFINDQRQIYYTSGLMVREFRPGVLLWYHVGRGQYGAKEQQVFTFATRAPNVSVVWAIRPSIELQDVLAIDREIWAAVRAMKDWPAHDLFPQYGF